MAFLGLLSKKRGRARSPEIVDRDPETPGGLDTSRDAVETIEHVMDGWVDPCGNQYLMQREPERTNEGDNSMSVAWSGFDKLDGEKLTQLAALSIAPFATRFVEADLRSGAVRVNFVRPGAAAKRARPTAAATEPAPPSAGDRLFQSDKDDVRKWLAGPIDQEDLDNILLYLQRIRAYIKENDLVVNNHRLSYDVKRKRASYIIVVKGFPVVTDGFIRALTGERACGVCTCLDFESQLLVIEVTKNKLPL